jgi:hypothetical protein
MPEQPTSTTTNPAIAATEAPCQSVGQNSSEDLNERKQSTRKYFSEKRGDAERAGIGGSAELEDRIRKQEEQRVRDEKRPEAKQTREQPSSPHRS